MTEKKFAPGDKVYHRSQPSIIWIVEEVIEDEVRCSTMNKGTLELKKAKFNAVTLTKVSSKGGGAILFGKFNNPRRY